MIFRVFQNDTEGSNKDESCCLCGSFLKSVLEMRALIQHLLRHVLPLPANREARQADHISQISCGWVEPLMQQGHQGSPYLPAIVR